MLIRYDWVWIFLEASYVDGFDFEWGYFYTLKVKEIYLGEFPDGTNYEYSLLNVISKEKVSDTLIFKYVNRSFEVLS